MVQRFDHLDVSFWASTLLITLNTIEFYQNHFGTPKRAADAVGLRGRVDRSPINDRADLFRQNDELAALCSR